MTGTAATWRKSSFSGGGNDCVLVRRDLRALGDTRERATLAGVDARALAAWAARGPAPDR